MIAEGRLVRCPAKINLCLRVLGPRPDGFHDIVTVFQAIDLEDRLEILEAGDWEVECDDPRVPADRDNLVVRAAAALAARAGVGRRARFVLRKRIPPGGGLGGGSSNAAGALLALERRWGVDLGAGERHALAASIGSDVAFFLLGGTAIGRGRGERLEPLAFPGELPVLLGLPPFSVSTAEVFAALRGRLTPPGKGVSVPPLSGVGTSGIVGVCSVGNDLEVVSFERWPVIGRFRDDLRETGAIAASMSGSGSAVFGLFESRSKRDAAGDELRDRYPDWKVVRASTSPHGARVDSAGSAG